MHGKPGWPRPMYSKEIKRAMGGRLGDRRSREHRQATLALLAFSEDSAQIHCRTITHVISVFLLGSSETKVTQPQTQSYKQNAVLFMLGAPAPGSHRTPQGASERCQNRRLPGRPRAALSRPSTSRAAFSRPGGSGKAGAKLPNCSRQRNQTR